MRDTDDDFALVDAEGDVPDWAVAVYDAAWALMFPTDPVRRASASTWACSGYRQDPLVPQFLFADLRDGLHGRAGMHAADRLAAQYPDLAAVPIDREHQDWILLRSIAILATRGQRRFGGEPPAFEILT